MTKQKRELKREIKRLIEQQQEAQERASYTPRPSYIALCVTHALQSGSYFQN